MVLKLGMLGMWHTHADGIVHQVAEYPNEITIIGFYDSDPAVASDRKRKWESKIPNFRVFDKPEALLNEPLEAIVVEGRIHENVGLARMAVESGRSVMLEKPAGVNLEDFQRLCEL